MFARIFIGEALFLALPKTLGMTDEDFRDASIGVTMTDRSEPQNEFARRTVEAMVLAARHLNSQACGTC